MRVVVVPVALVVVAGLAGCNFPPPKFFEVTASRTEECSIRANGEFCVEPEQFDPPTTTVWTVDFPDDREQRARVFVDEEVWVLDDIDDGADPYAVEHRATRSSIVTSGNGPCTSTKTEALQFTANASGTFAGTLSTSTVLTGPAACGENPTGERTTDNLVGSAFTAAGAQVGP